jgi:ABC transport system ATP-binding/permease protein
MSEQLLNAIIQLFALVAIQDGLTEKECKNIEEFLLEHLNEEAAEKNLKLFKDICQKHQSRVLMPAREDSDQDSFEFEKAETIRICKEINQDLSQSQKLVLILDIIKLVYADGEVSIKEMELVYHIGKAFRISQKAIDIIKAFIAMKSASDLSNDNALVIHNGFLSVNASCKQMVVDGFEGQIGILRIPTLEIYFFKYLGEVSITLNGAPVKNGTIGVLPTGSVIRAKKISPIYFSDIVARFIRNESHVNFSFEAENVTYEFKNGNLGLRNINIAEASGNLIGIMGASGSGKSTLLNVLNGNEKPTAGKVKINNVDIHSERDKVKGVIGYVPQDDLLIEDLTVFQNLYFAAKLCFSHYSKEQLKKLVLKTLASLGLSEIKDLRVGSPLDKTISGGQRKRLNIGLELLREPSILFVDEPTSGLSSRDSENIMDLLKELSLKGKLVFVVIHQPSSDIFLMFDKLIILDVGGYQIYYGNPMEAVVYFKNIINLVNRDQGACVECGNVNPEQIFDIIETKLINEYGRFTDQRKISPKQWYQYFLEHKQIQPVTQVNEKPTVALYLPNRVKQLFIFAARDIIAKVRNRQYLIINFLEAPVLAFILAFIVRYFPTSGLEKAYVFGKNINIPAYFFMSIIVALFMGLTVSAEEIIKDRKILKREAFLHLSHGSYLFSKLLILFSLSAFQTLSFVIVGNLILDIQEMHMANWLVLFSVSCFANVLGLNISSAFNSVITVYILIPLLLIPQIILSGVVVKFDKLNPWLTSEDKVPVVGEMMASRWAFEGLLVHQFKHNPFEEIFYDLDKAMAEADYKNIYYLPLLESKIEYCQQAIYKNMDDRQQAKFAADLDLVRKELNKELIFIGKDKFKKVDYLTSTGYSYALGKETLDFMRQLKVYYRNKFNKANYAKDRMVSLMSQENVLGQTYEELRNTFQNETVSDMVKNNKDAVRIVEQNGELIQKINPIYMSPSTDKGWWNFRTQLFLPEKHFAGLIFETLYFNVLVIWLMTIVLVIALFTGLLRWLIEIPATYTLFSRQKDKKI